MDVEIFLDVSEAPAENLPLIEDRFRAWYDDGAEIRHNKKSFGGLRPLDKPHRYLVDLGYADVITSFRDLHARLNRLGAKVFIHFQP